MVDDPNKFNNKLEDSDDLAHIDTQDLLKYIDTDEVIVFDPAYQKFAEDPAYQKYPEHWVKHPVLDELDTIYEFNVGLSCENSGKNSWMYSAKLQKVFIKMCKTFTVDISYTPKVENIPLYLRAMIVYSSSEDLHLPVNRCHNHENQPESNHHIDKSVLPHILRCKRSDTMYYGTKEGEHFGNRLTIVIPLGLSKKTTINENINFEFVCQNSCGMNRKSTAVIFTLENNCFEILGKKLMNFKVCSCPRRDKEKEEQTFSQDCSNKKNCHPSTGKKFKKEKTVDKIATVKKEVDSSEEMIDNYTNEGVQITLRLPDEQTALHVFKDAFNAVAGKMASDRNKADRYVPYIKRIKKQMENFNKQ